VVVPASRYGVYLATLALGFCPLMVDVVLDGRPHGLALSAVLALVYLSAAWLAWSYRRAFGQMFGLMRRTEALAGLLAEEKQRADAARRQAEEATASRSSFFVAASHDLRQPLQALLLFADALKHQALPAETIQLVDQVDSSARSLEALFDDLLDMSQLEAGSVQVRSRPVLLESVYRSVVLHCRPLAFDRGLALDLRGGSRWVQADPVLLERMLRNLVTNAINHTTDGGVLVTCRPRGADHWRLQVWDTGCGIPDASLPLVFDQFYRGPAPRGRGLGLGLTIAQAFASLMGTRLGARSSVGRGTVFSFDLPRADGAAAADSPPGRAQRALASLAGCGYVVVSAGLAEAEQVTEWLRAWRATVHLVRDVAALAVWAQARHAQGEPPPQGLVLGLATLEAQQAALLAWQREIGRAHV
jgi:signal transduction histidine kinase